MRTISTTSLVSRGSKDHRRNSVQKTIKEMFFWVIRLDLGANLMQTNTESFDADKNQMLVFVLGRHRWVIYTTEMNGKRTLWEVDGSMVPAEWYGL